MDVKLIFYSKENSFLGEYVIPEDKRYNKTLRRKKSLLDIAIDNNVPIKFGCMGGSCSACICEIKSGEEFVEKGGIKEQVYVTNGNKILTCMATIKDELSENAKIELKLGL